MLNGLVNKSLRARLSEMSTLQGTCAHRTLNTMASSSIITTLWPSQARQSTLQTLMSLTAPQDLELGKKKKVLRMVENFLALIHKTLLFQPHLIS